MRITRRAEKINLNHVVDISVDVHKETLCFYFEIGGHENYFSSISCGLRKLYTNAMMAINRKMLWNCSRKVVSIKYANPNTKAATIAIARDLLVTRGMKGEFFILNLR